MKPARAAVGGGPRCDRSVNTTPSTTAPTATTINAIEKTWAPWLWVVQSLELFVVQSLEFLGEFWVELFELFDESLDDFEESFDELDESPDPLEESDELLEPELD